MCIGYNPVAAAMPYLLSGVILGLINLLIYAAASIKKYDKNYLKLINIILSVISILLLVMAYSRLTLIAKLNC